MEKIKKKFGDMIIEVKFLEQGFLYHKYKVLLKKRYKKQMSYTFVTSNYEHESIFKQALTDIVDYYYNHNEMQHEHYHIGLSIRCFLEKSWVDSVEVYLKMLSESKNQGII